MQPSQFRRGGPSPMIGTEAEVTGFSTPGILCSDAGSAGAGCRNALCKAGKVFVHKSTVSNITYTRSLP